MKPPKNHLLLSGLIVAVAVFLGLQLYSRAEGGVITVCARKNGVMYLIGDGFKRTECGKNDTLLSWNIQGPPGPKGDKGDPGENLDLFDENAQNLGLLLDSDGRSYNILDADDGVAMTFREETGRVFIEGIIQTNVYYTGAGCTGEAFLEKGPTHGRHRLIFLGSQLLSDGAAGRFYKFVTPPAVDTRTRVSYRESGSGNCIATVAIGFPDTLLVEEISAPFSEPVIPPLEIRSQ